MEKKMIDKLIKQMGDKFAGLWGIHRIDEPFKYCVTFLYDSRYRETKDFLRPEDALKEAIRILKKWQEV